MAAKYVLDASALPYLFNQEEEQNRVRTALGEAVISAVNYSEVIAKLVERGGAIAAVGQALEHLHLMIVEFDRAQAVQAGMLRQDTREAGCRSETAPAWRWRSPAASSLSPPTRHGRGSTMPSASWSSWCAERMTATALLANATNWIRDEMGGRKDEHRSF
ncbi:PIN domain-containing protein [Methylobacterium sp. sgz302541]|uniref:PIN domain-containing protein n=1 Tax=unclassified Methylobacterium TaxID=2615210 RepID=UPI003D353E05